MKVALIIVLSLIVCGTAQARHPRHLSPEQAWVRSPFASCVRWRESTNGAGASNLYQIQGPNASSNDGDYEWLDWVSRAKQNWIAYKMFLRRGDNPWRPYDGCYWGMSSYH